MGKLTRLVVSFFFLVASFVSCVAGPTCLRAPAVSCDDRVIVLVDLSSLSDDKDREDVMNAAAMWQVATSGSSTFVFCRGCDRAETEHNVYVTVELVVSDDPRVNEWDSRFDLGIYGVAVRAANGRLTNVYIVSDRVLDRTNRTIVLAHELGHAMGLSHVQDTKSVMSKRLDLNVRHLSVHDLQEYCRVRNDCSCDVSLVEESEDVQ